MMNSAPCKREDRNTVVSFGERLKKEREKRGLTLEEVSAATKIGVRSLRALEQEKFDLLPGGIFNKGFVRAYAKHLGLDDEVVVADYLEAAGESSPAPTIADPTEAQNAQELRDLGSSQPLPWVTMAAIVVVGTLLLAVWHYYSQRKGSQGIAVQDSAVSSPASSSASSSGSASSEAPSAGAQSSSPATASPSPRASPITANSTPATSTVSASSSFELSLRAVDEVWLSMTVDAQQPSEAILSRGQSKTLQASDKVVIRVGNPVALQVSINGKRIPIRGVEGQPETLTFTAAGLQYDGGPPPKPD